VEVPRLGSVVVDVAYGGMLYAIVDAARLGFAIEPHEARDLVTVGERVKAAAAEQLPAVHPENSQIHTINQTLFAGPLTPAADGKTARSAVIVSPGRLDRSPCGTGTSARLAVLHAKGEMRAGETLDHVSIIGTHFLGRVEETTSVAGIPAVVNSISGRGFVTSISQYGLDPADPFPQGYTLPDTW
jgi:proline racemase